MPMELLRRQQGPTLQKNYSEQELQHLANLLKMAAGVMALGKPTETNSRGCIFRKINQRQELKY